MWNTIENLKKNKKLIGLLLLFVPIFFWSTHAVSMRYLIWEYDISPTLLTFYRALLGSAFILGVYFLSVIWKKWSVKKDFWELKKVFHDRVVWIVMWAFFLNLLTFNFGLKYTFATNTILIESLFPMIVFFLSLFFYKEYLDTNRKNIRKVFILLIIASIWVWLLVMNQSAEIPNSALKLFWDFMAFLSMIGLALFVMFNYILRKKYESVNGVLLTGTILGSAALICLPFILWEIWDFLAYNMEQILLIIYLGVWCVWLAFVFLFYVPRYLNHMAISVFLNIIWVTTLVFEYMIFKDSAILSINMLLWALLIVGAWMYIEYLNSKSEKEKNKNIDKK